MRITWKNTVSPVYFKHKRLSLEFDILFWRRGGKPVDMTYPSRIFLSKAEKYDGRKVTYPFYTFKKDLCESFDVLNESLNFRRA